MEHEIFASYVPSPYPNMMDLRISDQPFPGTSSHTTTPEPQHHSFDESSYLNSVPTEILNAQASSLAESSLDPWLVEMRATASPQPPSRLSMSPHQGINHSPSDSYYSPPYPEAPQVPVYQMMEHQQPPHTSSTSHPNWVSSNNDIQPEYAQGDAWGNQSLVPHPWAPNSYDGYTSLNVTSSHTHVGNAALPLFAYPAQDQVPAPETVRQTSVLSDEVSGELADSIEDSESSEEHSESEDEAPRDNQARAHASGSRSRPNPRSPSMRVDRWNLLVNTIQQSEIRGYMCDVPGCGTSFVRPEHLRRHLRSKHSSGKPFPCKVPGCGTHFSRGDNLRDHYWTHLHRGGRAGKNKKMNLPELKTILGAKREKLIRRLRDKQKKHMEKERLKKLRAARSPYFVRSML